MPPAACESGPRQSRHVAKEALKFVFYTGVSGICRWLPRRSVPILTYHSLDNSSSTISVTEERFTEQMIYLKENGFQSLTLAQLVAHWKRQSEVPNKSFVVTFDDGFRSVHTKAFPILERLGFRCTVFLVSGCLGKTCDWKLGPRNSRAGVRRFELMTWDQAREIQDHGHECTAHGTDHLQLNSATAEHARRDIRNCKHTIEDRLGEPCRMFCYPYGAYNRAVRDTVEELGFEAAVTTRFGRCCPGDDLFQLRRLGSAHFTSGPVFRSCIYGGYGWHLRLKRRQIESGWQPGKLRPSPPLHDGA